MSTTISNEVEGRPCCPAAATRGVRQLNVKGRTVGILGLNTYLEQVRALKLESDERIGAELMTRVKLTHYIPSSAQKEYERALLKAYHARYDNDG